VPNPIGFICLLHRNLDPICLRLDCCCYWLEVAKSHGDLQLWDSMLWIPLVCTPSKLRNPALAVRLDTEQPEAWHLIQPSTCKDTAESGRRRTVEEAAKAAGPVSFYILFFLFCQILPTRWSTVTNVRKKEVEDDLEKPYPPLKLTYRRKIDKTTFPFQMVPFQWRGSGQSHLTPESDPSKHFWKWWVSRFDRKFTILKKKEMMTSKAIFS